MRLSVLRLALPLAGFVACGGDDAVNHDAAVPIDSAKQPDASPDATTFKGFGADEGGEVRIEYVNFPTGMASIRVTDFFFKTAGSTAFHMIPSFAGCTNLDPAMGNWPTAMNPIPERVYEDPGLVLISGGPQTFTGRPNTADATDAFGRTHPAGHFTFFFGGPTANDAANYTGEKQPLTVTLTGSADMPAQVFKDVIYMPANFTLNTPGFTGSTLTAHTDATFTWTAPSQGNPPDHPVYNLLGFTGANGPAAICVIPDGTTVTMPAAMVDVVIAKYPNGGTIARQEFTHVVKELVDNTGPTGRRIDFIGVWCFAAPFTVTP